MFRAFVLLTALSVPLAACGSSGQTAVGSISPATTTSFTGTVPQGGAITIGAEQEPTCFDWIGSCSGTQWGTWIAQIETQPWAYTDVPTKNGTVAEVPSPVLAGPATMTPTPVETIRYNLNPKAVWSDGVPITCADFAYTADQLQHSNDIYDPTGYTGIDKVNCPDPKTVVVMYQKGQTYADWTALFSAGVGIFPSHLLEGKDRDAALKNGYSWSGGPWFAKWDKGVGVTLTPNPRYWGDKPKLDKVNFVFEKDTASEFQAFQSGQVQAIYPQPQIDTVDAIAAGLNDANHQYNANTAAIEGLWFNLSKPPFDSLAVRQAVGYAVDRDAIVNRLFGKLGVTKAVNSLNPAVIAAYSDPNAWARYGLDLAKVTSIMTGAGWAKGSDGIWAKGGQRASFTVNTTAGNKRRELTEEFLQQEFKVAGFEMKIDNSGDLFDTHVNPDGNFQAAIYGQQLTGLTPGLCSVLCTSAIPTPANHNSGNNDQRVSIPAADTLLATVDSSLDDAVRQSAAKQADDILADNDVALPLDPLPDVLIWNKHVVGPITDNPILGMFWNINEWGVTK